ncbi:MAG: FAD-dependent oxidoreductase [Deltaproteobacteria bacterium]|nr:FAD-dependent oxidoreductase [Deltaproteobacteria bacterium]
MRFEFETQVLIIGGGVTGSAIARELSRYSLDVILAEKDWDVAGGQTKGNGGVVYSARGLTWATSVIIKSFISAPGEKLFHPDSLKEKFIRRGFDNFPAVAHELGLSSYMRSNNLTIARDAEEAGILDKLEDLCLQLGSKPERLSRDDILSMEPNLTDKIYCGLLDRDNESFVYPWEYCIALAENAKDNGVRVLTGAEVFAIDSLNGEFVVDTARGKIRTEYIVNAAGGNADKIAEMAGVCDFGLTFIQGQTEILDKRLKGIVHCSINPVPRPGVGGRIVPSPSGNLAAGFIGYIKAKERNDKRRRREWADENMARTRELIPSITKDDIINSFTAMRVFNTRDPEDHIIEATKKEPKFINAVIRLPSLAASIEIARHVVNLLGDQGLELNEKDDFNPFRKGIPRPSELPHASREQLIDKDPRYGHIICRCEEVSEGEIVESIKRGARTVMAVSYRTRAGMGRCQGGFCGPRVVEIISRELDIPMTEVTRKGGLSRVLLYRSNELIG